MKVICCANSIDLTLFLVSIMLPVFAIAEIENIEGGIQETAAADSSARDLMRFRQENRQRS